MVLVVAEMVLMVSLLLHQAQRTQVAEVVARILKHRVLAVQA